MLDIGQQAPISVRLDGDRLVLVDGLHRLEAACLPTNTPSRSLLAKAGFQQEGYAREYLCINGLWQDHLLFARLAGD